MCFGHDERVALKREEDDHPVILVDDVGRGLAGDDAAEDAVVHRGEYSNCEAVSVAGCVAGPPTQVGAKGTAVPRSPLKWAGSATNLLLIRAGTASRPPVHWSGLRGRRPSAGTSVPVTRPRCTATRLRYDVQPVRIAQGDCI